MIDPYAYYTAMGDRHLIFTHGDRRRARLLEQVARWEDALRRVILWR